MPLAVFALMIASFGIGTTEFVIMGLLPEVAADMSVSLTRAGLLISGYALGVVFGGPVFTAAASRMPRKTMLLILMVLFIIGNALAAVAPAYWVLMVGRVFAAVCHGAFLGIGSVVAADLVDRDRRSRAISLVFTGLTVANVFGAPMGTWIGQSFDWRATFWMITAIGVVSLIGLIVLVPTRRNETPARLRDELGVFARGQVWAALAIAGLSIGSLFAAFSYISPLMTEVAGFSSGMLTPLLVLFGIGLVAGNLLGGRYADRAQVATLLTAQAALVAVLLVFTLTVQFQVAAAATLMLLGGAGFATVPGFMTRVIDKAAGAPTLASAVASSAANAGIAVGSYLAGATIDAGLGYTAPLWVGAAMAAVAFAVTFASGALDRRGSLARAAGAAAEPRLAGSSQGEAR
ncbi:MFS transporter [Thermobifida halotolerans]|uniref:MFS transporter n=1 Tax=Thermobifida halotolerans TaxID=483545 RepID=A0A399G2S4_9ACTN|nr:MFS transporter [Thermobifida halotolerans]UOE19984.1 MFS transporter [Thermobifida halotolerans]